MGPSDEESVLAALEQAEMAARERRLAASDKAEDIVSAARLRAQGITDGAGQRVEAALDELRRSSEAAADAAIEELEAGTTRRASSDRGAGERSTEQAVALVVAHVLGEATPGSERGDPA